MELGGNRIEVVQKVLTVAILKYSSEPGIVAHTFSPRTREAKTGGSL